MEKNIKSAANVKNKIGLSMIGLLKFIIMIIIF